MESQECWEEAASGTASVWLLWKAAVVRWASLVSRMRHPNSHRHALGELNNQAPRKRG
ncbi:hypothetical protein GQ55_7G324600 [Panicum hallii var. hallii]|uniref:Uncharacterized protein n=1 Tax=Panicum hallii var. hallii TaxID=1504633 RepID=A0A2T7D1I7_9POAL|nr:hypothetical protein GQ55_7G324600 [Panicum hallii var. hallii]